MPIWESVVKRLWKLLPAAARDKLRTTRAVICLRNWISRRRYRGASHDEIFDDEYFGFVEKTTLQGAEIIADSVVTEFRPAAVWDVGCGTGTLLASLQDRGVRGRGLELAEAALRRCHARQLDVHRFNILTDPAPNSPADVVLSLEVGAQLPASAADRYVDLLCCLGPIVVFSAEEPGGGDRVALNEQPHSYWVQKFAHRGYDLQPRPTFEWRKHWKEQAVPAWFCRNVMVFKNPDRSSRSSI